MNIVAVILIVLWVLGLATGYTIGNFVYILLAAGCALLIIEWRLKSIRAPGRRHSRRKLMAALVLVVASVAAFLSLATRLTPLVRDRGIAAVNARFDSEVELQAVQVALFPRPELNGEGLLLRHRGRRDVPPLITIDSFSSGAGVAGLMGKRLHLHTLELSGLAIRLPPGGPNGDLPKTDPAEKGTPKRRANVPLLIDRIVSRAARLEIASRDPDKLPRIFEIHDLVLQDFGPEQASMFEASLTNPKPKGNIQTTGTFGPWHAQDPRQTPIGGKYRFEHADLNTIKGIGGQLSSTGSFGGVLERIAVRGETDTPDFTVDVAGSPVLLHTKFEAVVDGTNGNTTLDSVEATIARRSVILARGAIVRAVDIKGRNVSLDVTSTNARIEDFLTLAVKSAAPLTGVVSLKTTMLLPAGEKDVLDRLDLNGQFSLAQARFTSMNIQKQVDTLSRTGQGNEESAPNGSVVSNMQGQFVLKNAVLHISRLTFAVPGASVQLAGAYDLRRETLDFSGDLLLDAALHDMTSGFKALIARAAQPFFRRPGGGSKIPIRISGTRSKPAFGLDVKRSLTPGK